MYGLDDLQRINEEAARRELASNQPKPLTDVERESNLELMVNGLTLPELPGAIPAPIVLTWELLEENSGQIMELLPRYDELNLEEGFVPEGYTLTRQVCCIPGLPNDFPGDTFFNEIQFVTQLVLAIQMAEELDIHPAYAITCSCPMGLEVSIYRPDGE